jgi:hypothetical protein
MVNVPIVPLQECRLLLLRHYCLWKADSACLSAAAPAKSPKAYDQAAWV